jgi:hypothetical protein
MKQLITICTVVVMVLAAAEPLQADWQRTPASDVDKEFISGNGGIAAGVPPSDMSCWMAAASNMLAGAGYGNGATIQQRAEDIYLDMLVWRNSIDPTNTHGVRDGGWMDNALNWWLASANNTWPANPYTVVTVYGNTSKIPWSNSSGAKYIGNQLRDYQQVGLSISKPRTSASGIPSGGHAITAWGDSGTSSTLASNPSLVIIGDSDRDTGGDFQTYTYDSYTNPNPGGFNEGNGWYFNFSSNHWFIKHIATLCPTDSPVDPHDGPTQKVVGSYKIHQDDLESATDLHYTAWTDYNILGYRTEIDWPTNNDPCITESNTHVPSLTRSDINVDWDLADNPVPYDKDVTITTEFILQNWNGIWYDDVYFTYPGAEDTKYLQPPYNSSLGTDIRVDNKDGIDRLLADDFPCTTTGEITKIYLWGSWNNDGRTGPAPGTIQKFHLYIYSDDPVGDNPNDPNDDKYNKYSKPLKLLWSGNFGQFTETVYSLVQEEYFWDPYVTIPLSWDNRIWSYVIKIPEADAFKQQGSRTNPITYWLGVSAEITGKEKPQFGWKTTDLKNRWNDTAVAWKDTYTLTDRFDYWEDQTTHSYLASGSCFEGAYSCATDDSLRIGDCDANASAQIKVAVIPGTEEVKLRYRVPWAGTSGATLYVDGVNQGSITSNGCDWQEKILTGMSANTADGLLDIKIVDEINGCDGDIQITYLEVYSMEKEWLPLSYPTGHELAGYPVDMSFGIVTPASAPGQFLPEFGWNIVTPELADTNITDITGGYVVGGFDIYDLSAEPNLMGQYRFVHQYPYMQDPEHHVFTIQGPRDQSSCEYVATNFRFGHSYGMLDSESLWQFSEWMTTSENKVYLCAGKPLQLTLDWQGRLPYPPSNITPAHEIPDAPACTVYLEGDINKDCCVDFRDVAILAAQWLQCTTP